MRLGDALPMVIVPPPTNRVPLAIRKSVGLPAELNKIVPLFVIVFVNPTATLLTT